MIELDVPHTVDGLQTQQRGSGPTLAQIEFSLDKDIAQTLTGPGMLDKLHPYYELNANTTVKEQRIRFPMVFQDIDSCNHCQQLLEIRSKVQVRNQWGALAICQLTLQFGSHHKSCVSTVGSKRTEQAPVLLDRLAQCNHVNWQSWTKTLSEKLMVLEFMTEIYAQAKTL